MTLPTDTSPQQGIFVANRLLGVAKFAAVRALRPQPWFPGLTGRKLEPSTLGRLQIDSRRMFYFPRIAKSLDGFWMRRCVESWLREFDALQVRTVVDAHFGYPEGVGCFLAAKRFKLPCFITLRGVETDWFKKAGIKKQLLLALNNATGVISVSDSLRDLAISHGVPDSKVVVIPNGCDGLVFSAGGKEEARKELSIPSSIQKLLVCVANLKPIKGHDLLLNSLAKLKSACTWHLVCLGKAESDFYRIHLERLRDELGLKSRVDFVGEQTPQQVANYLNASDLFVLASRREGCCNAITEALACNCKIVCTDVGDNRKMLTGYPASWIVPSENCQSLSAAIEKALASATPNPVENFSPLSWEKVGERTVEFFQDRIRHANAN